MTKLRKLILIFYACGTVVLTVFVIPYEYFDGRFAEEYSTIWSPPETVYESLDITLTDHTRLDVKRLLAQLWVWNVVCGVSFILLDETTKETIK